MAQRGAVRQDHCVNREGTRHASPLRLCFLPRGPSHSGSRHRHSPPALSTLILRLHLPPSLRRVVCPLTPSTNTSLPTIFHLTSSSCTVTPPASLPAYVVAPRSRRPYRLSHLIIPSVAPEPGSPSRLLRHLCTHARRRDNPPAHPPVPPAGNLVTSSLRSRLASSAECHRAFESTSPRLNWSCAARPSLLNRHLASALHTPHDSHHY